MADNTPYEPAATLVGRLFLHGDWLYIKDADGRPGGSAPHQWVSLAKYDNGWSYEVPKEAVQIIAWTLDDLATYGGSHKHASEDKLKSGLREGIRCAAELKRRATTPTLAEDLMEVLDATHCSGPASDAVERLAAFLNNGGKLQP